jgi:hypothetical protein
MIYFVYTFILKHFVLSSIILIIIFLYSVSNIFIYFCNTNDISTNVLTISYVNEIKKYLLYFKRD